MSESFLKPLESALRGRNEFLKQCESKNTDCYRLFCGEGEGIPGFVVERFGKTIIFQYHEGSCALSTQQLESIAQWYGKQFGTTSVYLKKFIPDRSSTSASNQYYEDKPFWGDISEALLICRENGVALEIHPYDGFSTGIFLDQRNNRKYLQELSSGLRVLNCFSYTCGFSVFCALGKGETTSVDLSRKYLDWGKRNFQHNRLVAESHQFYAVDVFEQFKKARKLGKQYDLIILDPPSFSRNHEGKVFSVKRDLRGLVLEAVSVLESNGILFVSSNLNSLSSQSLENDVFEALREAPRKSKKLNLPPTPTDFIHSENHLSASCFQVC